MAVISLKIRDRGAASGHRSDPIPQIGEHPTLDFGNPCSPHLCAGKLKATISEAHGAVIHRFIIGILRERGMVGAARRRSN
jgi:hypothetical protein